MRADTFGVLRLVVVSACVAVVIGSCGGGGSGGASSSSGSASSTTGTTEEAAPAIASQPQSQSVPLGYAATFSVRVSGTPAPSFQWLRNGATIAGATASSYVTPVVAVADSGAQFSVKVTNSVGSVQSASATLSVVGPDVTTYHNDNLRTGTNPYEAVLNPGTVNSAKFGKLRTLSVDGLVDAQPLYLHQLNINATPHNVVYVATENASVYAFDSDSGVILWQKSTLVGSESASDDRGCGQVVPTIGITSTPAIDRSAGPNGAIYLVAMSKDSQGHYYQRLHALDLTTGAELFGGPTTISATYPSKSGSISFVPAQYKERAAVLIQKGTVYIAFSSHCDAETYYGWVMAYSESTLKQTGVLNVTPNGSEGSIWQSGGGLTADAEGNIYFLDANGTFDATLDASGFPANGDFGNAFLKVSTASGLKVADYFATWNTTAESNVDEDLGSGGAMLLPDLLDSTGATRQLAVGAGKDGHIFVVDRTSMGKFNSAAGANSNPNVYQDLAGTLGGNSVYSVPAYFNGVVYYGAVGDQLKAIPVTAAKLALTPSSKSAGSFTYPGTFPSISANGSGGAIVWAVENTPNAVLHAYDAKNLSNELYNSNQQASRDQFGAGNKYVVPTVVDGKVLVGGPSLVAVFGLLP